MAIDWTRPREGERAGVRGPRDPGEELAKSPRDCLSQMAMWGEQLGEGQRSAEGWGLKVGVGHASHD